MNRTFTNPRLKLPVLGAILASAAAALSQSVPAAADEPVTIRVWNWGGTQEQVMNSLLPGFKAAYPNIDLKIESTAVGGNARVDKLAVALAAGEAPDVTIASTRQAPQFVAKGAFLPLTDAVLASVFGASSRAAFTDRYYPGFFDTVAIDNQLYFVPNEVTTTGLFVNNDILKRLGIGQVPTTWADLASIGQKITQKDASGQYAQIGVEMSRGTWATLMLTAMMRQSGTDWISSDKTRAQFDSDGARKAWSAFQNLFVSGAAVYNSSGFRTGQTAFWPFGSYFYFHLAGHTQGWGNFDWSTAPLPTLVGGTPNDSVYSWGFYVTSQTKHPKEAWEVVNYFTNSKAAQAWFDIGKVMIPYKATWFNRELDKMPKYRTFVDALQHGQMEMTTPYYNAIAAKLEAQADAVAQNQVPVASALAMLQQQVQAILTTGGKAG